MNESKAMIKIHKIREQHYEETKNMNSKEYLSNIKKRANTAKYRIAEIRISKNLKNRDA